MSGTGHGGWQDGYVTEIGYTYGYYPELNPARLGLAATLAGIGHTVPEAPSYLELGFGQGVSINIHAAARPGTFWGTDFNAAQAGFAQSLARAAGSGAQLFDMSFAEMAARDDLPEFDVIALHGIWTWISDENRAHIVDIARRRLRPGGLFYVSYNVTPGWSPNMPLRHLMTEHARLASAGGMQRRIDAALEFAKSLADADAAYFRANPGAKARLEQISGQNRNYLAHEYMNASWDVMPFSKTAGMLAEAKLDFAASAHLLDHVDPINLSEAAQKVLAGIESAELRQTARDYFVNQQFRRDVFVKGARRLSALEQARTLRRQPFVLVTTPEAVTLKTNGALGEVTLNEDVYAPIVAALAENGHAPRTIDDLAQVPACAQLTHAQFVQALTVLCGKGDVAPAQEAQAAKAQTKAAQALNAALCAQAETSSDVTTLAAPTTGAGIPVGRFEQLFLRGLATRQKDVPGWVWNVLNIQNQRLVREGQTIESQEDNLAELTRQYEAFCKARLPILQRLGVTAR